MSDNVLEPFEQEVVERNAVWEGHGAAPRMTYQNHRDGTSTRILVRSDTTPEARSVTVWFSPAEWKVIERAVLAGLGLTRAEE